jgi:general secretion pathway protein D
MTIHRALHFLAPILALACSVPVSLFADPVPVVSAGSAAATFGTPFSVPVSISGVSDLYAFQFDIAFDPGILQLVSITEGAFLPGAGTTFFGPGTIDNTAGTAIFTFDTLVGPISGASGSGDMASLTFQYIHLGTSPLTLSNVVLEDSSLNDIPFSISNGAVTLMPEPSAPFWAVATLALLPMFAKKIRRSAKARV